MAGGFNTPGTKDVVIVFFIVMGTGILIGTGLGWMFL